MYTSVHTVIWYGICYGGNCETMNIERMQSVCYAAGLVFVCLFVCFLVKGLEVMESKEVRSLFRSLAFLESLAPSSPQAAELCVRLLARVAAWGDRIRKDFLQLRTDQVAIGGRLMQGQHFYFRVHNNEHATDRQTKLLMNQTASDCKQLAENLSSLVPRRQALVDEHVLFIQAASAVTHYRSKVLRWWHNSETAKAASKQHAGTLSMLLASETSEQWKGRLSTFHHYDSIQGNVINSSVNCGGKLPRTLEEKDRRISNAKGERLWDKHSVPNAEYTRTRWQRMAEHATRSGSPLYKVWRELAGPNAEGPAFTIHSVRGILRVWKRLKAAGKLLMQPRVYSRLLSQLSGVRQESQRQWIVELPRQVLTGIPTGLSHSFFTNVRLDVWRVEVVTDDGITYAEYGFCRLPEAAGELPTNIVRSVQSYHCSVDTTPEAATQELLLRLQLETERLNRPWNGRMTPTQIQEQQRQQRKTMADYLRKLRSIPYVSLQDSYATGNCVPGTKRFCDEMGIQTPTMSGSELAKRWKVAGYPFNTLFLRVIDSMTKTTAGGVK